MGADGNTEARAVADAVARRSYGKLIAYLAAHTRDVAAAEDAMADAFATALETWSAQGCPTNPEAWLLTVARRKSIDVVRRQRKGDAIASQLRVLIDELVDADTEIPDRRLGLLFACAHPALDSGIRAPLMLQVVLGLDAESIAGAFLTTPSAMSKRLVRAKHKIRSAGIPFAVPDRDEWPVRLDAVLDAIYAAFAEGWTDPGGTDVVRRDLTDEAIYLARLLVELLPSEPEALGLLALILHAHARRSARRGDDGDYVPLDGQDPERWDTAAIDEAEAVLTHAGTFAAIGRFQLEAALQSAHVHRRRSGIDNWAAIAQLYDALLSLTASPVVALNRAIAVAHRDGAAAGLELVDALANEPALAQYQPYWAARAELLATTGASAAARQAYDVAIGLERDDAVRRFLRRRQAAMH